MAAAEGSTGTAVYIYNSLMQSQIPEAMRGRVYTLRDLTWNLMRLVSLGIDGLLVDTAGIHAVYYIGGTLLIGAGLLGLILLRTHAFARPLQELRSEAEL